MKAKILAILLIICGISENIFSQQFQQIYRTLKGDIAITIKYNDSALIAASNQLTVVLDYETSKINFWVDYSTLHTGIDSIDNKLKLLERQGFQFTGKLDILINTQKHPPQKFNLMGMMNSTNPPIAVEGKGTLVHLQTGGDSNTPVCTLTATIKFSLAGLNLNDIFKNADNDIQIDIRQSLLEKEKAN